jgi:chromate transport protein ChrA
MLPPSIAGAGGGARPGLLKTHFPKRRVWRDVQELNIRYAISFLIPGPKTGFIADIRPSATRQPLTINH